MKILAFTVRVECDECHGAKRVRRYRSDREDPNGETVDCHVCNGLGHVEAVVPFDEFAKLVRGMAALDRGKTVSR